MYSRCVSTRRKRPRRRWALLVVPLLVVTLLLIIGVALRGALFDARRAAAPPAATPPLPRTPPRAPPAAWLGLNYNSGSNTGSLSDFARRGIVYDREGSLEVRAGKTPENFPIFASGLAASYAAGMVPDVVVDPATAPHGCKTDPVPTKFCLPTRETQVASYVQGFVQTASSVLHMYPGAQVLFEPTDEPWSWASPPGTKPGKRAAAEFAFILAQLLPAARAAKVPLGDIYVPANGRLNDGTSWIPDLYEAQPCLKPGSGSCGPIAAWNLHPYGPPHSTTEGIDSVPGVRAEMHSGADNVVVSEIGFCAVDVNRGRGCDQNGPDVVGTSAQTATWLRKTLIAAARMHRAGWLKALLIWERAGTGLAMQNRTGALTAQGRVLDLFADSELSH